MTYKLKLNQVREVLGMEIKFEIVKLKDGTIVEVEKSEVGFPAFVIAEGGDKKPAPTGDHELEDGTVITIDENGLISKIVAKAAAEDDDEATVVEVSGSKAFAEDKESTKVDVAMKDKEDEKMAEKDHKMAEEVKKDVEMVKEACKALYAAIEEVAKEVSAVKEEMGAMKGKMEKFSKAPAANPIPKVTAANVVDAYDAIEAKAEFLKSIAKK